MINQLLTAKEIADRANVKLSSVKSFLWSNNITFDGIKKGVSAYTLTKANIIGQRVKDKKIKHQVKLIREIRKLR